MTSVIAMRCDNTRVVPMETIEVEEYNPCDWLSDSGATTPGDDIWSKFEMEVTESIYPTPPLSPESKTDASSMCWQEVSGFQHQTKTDLGLDYSDWHPEHSVDITPLLELDSEMDSKGLQEFPNTRTDMFKKPKSELKVSLIQDCMWSAYKKLMLKDSEKMGASNLKASSQETMYNEFSQPSDCVDPTTVFPYPLSMTETQLDLNLGGQSSSHSDSEEEIDVVTIALDSAQEDKKKSSKRESHKHKPRRMYEVSNPEHDYAKPGPKHSHKLGRSFKRSKNISPSVSQNCFKRKRSSEGVNPIALTKALEGCDKSRMLGMYNPASSRGSSKNSSRCSSQGGSHSASDSEDCDKRVNHNVLERKRREDLRSAFFRLRDRIPELESKERASKVVILEKSRTYVMKLRKDQMDLLHKKEILANKQKDLMARLRKLRTR